MARDYNLVPTFRPLEDATAGISRVSSMFDKAISGLVGLAQQNDQRTLDQTRGMIAGNTTLAAEAQRAELNKLAQLDADKQIQYQSAVAQANAITDPKARANALTQAQSLLPEIRNIATSVPSFSNEGKSVEDMVSINALNKQLEPFINTAQSAYDRQRAELLNRTGDAIKFSDTGFDQRFKLDQEAARVKDAAAARAIQAGQLQLQKDEYNRKVAEDAYKKEQDRLFRQSLLSSATDTSGVNLTGPTTENTTNVGNNPILGSIVDSFNSLKSKDGGYTTQDVTSTAAQLKQGIENAAMDEAKRQAVASGVIVDKLPSLIDNLYKRNLTKYAPELTAISTAEKDFTGQLESSRKLQIEKNKKAEETEIAGNLALEEALNKQFTRSPGITEFRSTVQEQANAVADTVGILSNIKDPSGRRVFDNKVLAKAVDSYKGDINDMEGFVQTLKSSLTTNKNLDPAAQYALNSRFDALLNKGSALKDITPEQVISEFKDALLKDAQGFLVDVPDDVRQSYIKKYQGLVPNKLPSRNQNKE